MPEYDFKLLDIIGDVIYGYVPANGQNLRKVAHDFLEASPLCPLAKNLCIVESWIMHEGSTYRNLQKGDWYAAFECKDAALLEAIKQGQQTVRIVKNSNEPTLVEIKKCLEVKKMSAYEQINQLARRRIQKSNKPSDMAGERAVVRKENPTLAAQERREAAAERMARSIPLRKDVDEKVEEEIEQRARALMAQDSSLDLSTARARVRAMNPHLREKVEGDPSIRIGVS